MYIFRETKDDVSTSLYVILKSKNVHIHNYRKIAVALQKCSQTNRNHSIVTYCATSISADIITFQGL